MKYYKMQFKAKKHDFEKDIESIYTIYYSFFNDKKDCLQENPTPQSCLSW